MVQRKLVSPLLGTSLAGTQSAITTARENEAEGGWDLSWQRKPSLSGLTVVSAHGMASGSTETPVDNSPLMGLCGGY